ncbi:Mitochondrial MRF1 N(5)-glutamine methyltransferase MTQ1 [Nakaseomyces bracarensis]|uniref:peptide chain release factor N(5)-glutamine methyltransferase n=1 Tax=Nakaseomyces bracarensis TaxID=273131 RepID=A0ABR4NPX5_9SACH
MRIRPRVAWEAWRCDRLLPLLLPECRTLESSKVELGWIKASMPDSVGRAVRARYWRYPLQYVLGTQPFGSVEVRCGRKVLIPRWETEEWCMRLADSIEQNSSSIRKLVLWDLCTGTGCIPMCLHEQLHAKKIPVEITAIDVSPDAVRLAQHNCKGRNIKIIQQDILASKSIPHELHGERIDVLTCNPPYIPRKHFSSGTTKSVKLFEPHLALIGDKEFYDNLLAKWLPNTNSFIYEIGDESQFRYVKDRLENKEWTVDLFIDSNGKPRCVYGYRNDVGHITEIFKAFASL